MEVLKLMEVKVKKKKTWLAWPRLTSCDDSKSFSIGNISIQAVVIKTVKDQPWLLMHNWAWPSDLSYLELVVGKLFVQFICQFWLPIVDTWLIDPVNTEHQT